MRDREIDDILKQAGQDSSPVDPALLHRIAKSIGSNLQPVRPVPPSWALTVGLSVICVAVAGGGAALLGLAGIHKLDVWERALIFPVLALLIWLAATGFVSEMIPGSRRRIAPISLLWAGSLALLAVFAILFHDYQTIRFLSQGMTCLTAGLLHAIPTALASWLLLRRGFAVNPVASGMVTGILAGLAGVTMLELHCPNFEAFHVMVWHTAVMLISGAAGALLGRFRSFSG